jgi:NAD+ diphosphatase
VHFAVVVSPDQADDSWTGLRGVIRQVDEKEAALVVHAIGVAEWLFATRHCPRCGGDLVPEQLGHVLRCTSCGREEFPRTDPAVIMVVVDGESPDDRCLLGRHPAWPPGQYSTLAGFVEPGESIEQAVRREVFEESGIRVGAVDYYGSQPWPLPRSLMIGCIAQAESTAVSVDGVEIEDARWFTREQMKAEAEAGTLLLPGGISISRSLVEHWYGGPLPGQW